MKRASALAFVAIAAVSFARSEGIVYFGVAKNGGSTAVAAAKQFGQVLAVDQKEGFYKLSLLGGLSEGNVAQHMARHRGVVTAWSDSWQPHPDSIRFSSSTEIQRLIDKLEGRSTRTIGAKQDSGEEEEEHGTDYLRSLLDRIRLRAYPYDKVDWSAYDRAKAHARKMKAAKIGVGGKPGGLSTLSYDSAAAAVGGTWEYIGPNDLNTPYRTYFGLRPSSGRINAIAYDPSNTNTIYAGGAWGGLAKSLDGGKTWKHIGDGWDATNVSCISIDPSNPQTIYVGTGDFHGFDGYSNGIMKSTNGGLTWTVLGKSNFPNVAVSALVIDPENPSILVATTGRGAAFNGFVWRSTNGGTSWSAVINVAAPWSDVTIGARDSNGRRPYYAAGGGAAGVYKSTDQGATWTKLSPSLGANGNIAIAASKTNPNNVYLLSPADEKIFRSTDGGSSWNDTTNNFPGGYNWSQSWYDYHITTAPSAGNDIVYVGLIDIVRSSDGGASWASVGGPTYSGGALTHNDQHSLAVNPTNPNEVLIGNDGGLYRLNPNGSIDGLSKTLGMTQFYHAAFHPSDPKRMVGGTQDNASPVSLGNLDRWENVGGGDGGFCVINPFNPANQFVTIYGFTVIMTKDNWATSKNISPPAFGDNLPFVTPIFPDPTNANQIYGATNYLWRYNIANNTWQGRLGNQALSNGLVRAVAVAPSNGNTIYTGSDDGQVWMSTNGGAAWKRINGPGSNLPNRAVTSISVDPANPSDILVGLSGTGSAHVYRCTNTKATQPTFSSVSGTGLNALPDIPLNRIARDPSSAKTWYVGTDIGVFTTADGGLTWQNATVPQGLPNVQVTAIEAMPGTGYLNVATYGRGIWRIRLGQRISSKPRSFEVVFGALTSGGLASLMDNDGSNLIVSTEKVAGTGNVSGIRAEFEFAPGSKLTNAEVSVKATGSTSTTFQLFALNTQTNEYEFIKAYPISTGAKSFKLPLGSNPARFMSSTGTLNLIVRALRPERLSAKGFQFSIDSISVDASVQN